MSGRGLGHTGGTLDKLESIPGLRTELSLAAMRTQVERVGVAVCGQSADLAPADGRLYALRDVTATIDSIPLIATSVMSKKVASGATRLVLDVKAGEGAFMPDAESAGELAALMERLGAANGIETHAVISSMDEPLGRAVGNALEVEEAVATLSGAGPGDLQELVLAEAAVLVGDADRVGEALRSGDALDTYRHWISAQGGDPEAELPKAPVVADVTAPADATVSRCHARRVGDLAMELGGGRMVKGAPIDHAVGVVVHKKGGEQVARGEPLATVHSREPVEPERVLACFQLDPVDA
jgi:pyrimidine-nucleoside phosphorylase